MPPLPKKALNRSKKVQPKGLLKEALQKRKPKSKVVESEVKPPQRTLRELVDLLSQLRLDLQRSASILNHLEMELFCYGLDCTKPLQETPDDIPF